MIFHEKYEFADLVEDENAKLYLATEIPTGRRVSVFLFEGDQARIHSELIERLITADRDQFPELVEVGSEQGNYYVVTQPLGGFCDLKALAGRLKDPAGSKKTGEFTKVGVFRVPKTLLSPPGKPEKAAAPSGAAREIPVSIKPFPAPPPAPSASQQKSGEFTRLFQAPATPIGESVPVQPRTPEQPPAPAPLTEPKPGDFTRLFEAPAVPVGESASAVPPGQVSSPAQTAPGEFTRFFQSAPVSPEPAAVGSGSAQGQFTRIFGSGSPEVQPEALSSLLDSPSSSVAPADSAPSAFSAPAGEFTRIFGGVSAETPSPAQEAPIPTAPGIPQTSAAPGEYTRIFGAQPAAAEPVADQPAEPPVPAVSGSQAQLSKSSRLPLVIGGLILLLLIVIAILMVTTKI